MQESEIIVFEYLDFKTLNSLIFTSKIKKKNRIIYYIYSNNFYYNFFSFFGKIFNLRFKRLNFKMINIRDNNNQIYRLTIAEKILFNFEKEFSIELSKHKHINYFRNFKYYVLKSIFSEHFHKESSAFRFTYLINVVEQIFKKGKNNIIFYTKERIAYEVYNKYALNKDITLKKISSYNLKIRLLICYSIFKSFLKNFYFTSRENKIFDNNKLFCEGKSQPNLKLNGERSDLNWLLTSDFIPNNVLYNCRDQKDEIRLNNFGINTTHNFQYKNNYINKLSKQKYLKYKIFDKKIDNLTECKHFFDYKYNFNKWFNYFLNHNVKVFLSWYKYDSLHIPMHDAINEIGGISTFFQPNFDGTSFYECKLFTDINFCNSQFSTSIDKNNLSKIDTNIIVGYPSTPITKQMITSAKEIRNQLLNNGAQKIICVLDENSLDDSRWHTGHELQIENYSYIIEKLLIDKNIGVIFKPKSAYDLRKRLKEANKLLDQAINTGRCYLYDQVEDNKDKFTKPTPTLAALSSDLVIHGHLCAGTAAIETALLGKPTLFIDRENAVNSIFHKVLNKNVIYKNWTEIILSINENFINNDTKDFGYWGEALTHFDPFRDNLGSKRIGDFLHQLLIGFNKGFQKQQIIEKTIEGYKKQWGKDKVIY